MDWDDGLHVQRTGRGSIRHSAELLCVLKGVNYGQLFFVSWSGGLAEELGPNA
jgi:hypothetical protein